MKVSNEFKVGIIAILAILIFITSTIFLGKLKFGEVGYKLRVRFNFIGDLKIGAPVIFAGGVRVGKVIDIIPVQDKIEVVIWLKKDFKIKRGTEIFIYTMGLLGEKYIEIHGYEGEGEYLNDGDVIIGTDPISLDEITIKLAKVMKGVFGPTLRDEDVRKSFAQLFNNAGELVYHLDALIKESRPPLQSTILNIQRSTESLEKNLNIVLQELANLSANLTDISKENQKVINDTIKNLNEISAQLAIAMNDLKKSSDNLNDITTAIKNKKGTIGKLIYNDEIYKNLKITSENFVSFSEQIKKNPRVIFFK